MITTTRKAELMKEFGKTEKDSGSAPVQVAILTERIKNLTTHFSSNKLDHHSKRGLMKLIGKRRRLLKYVASNDEQQYKDLITKLGLRK